MSAQGEGGEGRWMVVCDRATRKVKDWIWVYSNQSVKLKAGEELRSPTADEFMYGGEPGTRRDGRPIREPGEDEKESEDMETMKYEPARLTIADRIDGLDEATAQQRSELVSLEEAFDQLLRRVDRLERELGLGHIGEAPTQPGD